MILENYMRQNTYAAARVEWLAIVPVLVADVCALSIAVVGRTNGVVAQEHGITVSTAVVNCLIDIAIGAGNTVYHDQCKTSLAF